MLPLAMQEGYSLMPYLDLCLENKLIAKIKKILRIFVNTKPRIFHILQPGIIKKLEASTNKWSIEIIIKKILSHYYRNPTYYAVYDATVNLHQPNLFNRI